MSDQKEVYVPHANYAGERQTDAPGQPPAQPDIPLVTMEPINSDKDESSTSERPNSYLQPMPPAYNSRNRQQYLPHGSPPLSTHGLPRSSRDGSNLSARTPSPASYVAGDPRRTSMRLANSSGMNTGGLKSSWSQESLDLPPQWILRMRAFLTRWFVEWWLAEMISWLFSAVCFCTIIAVLFYFDRRQLPQWPMGLTLNSFISIFSGFAKSALLLPTCEAVGQLKWNWFREEPRALLDFEIMDAATRGPLGSFLLLFRSLRQRGLAVASIGAAIIILCLPFDLFFQQVISYPAVWVPHGPNSTIPIAHTYQSPGLKFMNGTETLQVEPKFSPALTELFYTNGSTPRVASYCPASNCTFNAFDTLAVCSMCDDTVSNLLDYGCFEGPGDWLTDSFTVYDPTTVPNITACGYYLNITSEDRVLMTGYLVDPVTGAPGQTLDSRVFPLVDAITRTKRWGGSIKFKDLSDPLFDSIIAGTPGGSSAIYAKAKPIVRECALTWCTQTLNSTVFQGNVTETPIHTFIDRSSSGTAWKTIDCPDCLGGEDYYYTRNISLPKASRYSSNDTDVVPVEERVITVSNNTFVSTVFALDDLSPSYFTTTNKSVMMIYGEQTDTFFKYRTPYQLGANSIRTAVNPWLPPFDIDAQMAKIAKTMSVIIRNNPAQDGNVDIIPGASWDSKVFVNIRWGWLVLPMFLLALGLGLLCLTVLRTTRESSLVGIWKNSVVAILFNGLDETTQKSVPPNAGLAEARSRARDLKVSIVPD